MRVLVVSDTHGRADLLLEAARHAGHTDVLLHLGDGARDCAVLEGRYDGVVWQVRGNCDFSPVDETERMLEMGGVPVWMTHGHLYDAKITLNKLWYRSRELNANAVCFGHTHVPLLDRQGEMFLINPGSLRYSGTYALLEIHEGKLDASLHELLK